MVRTYTCPRREWFDTEEEYLEELDYFDAEENLREMAATERYYENR